MIRMVGVCAVLMAAMLPAPRVDAAGPEPVLNFDVVGVSQPVDILIDPWGVPHVFAGTVNDAFFAQGFMTARDRLWQIDLARRRALGRLAAVLGPAFVPFDHAARLFLDRRDPVVLLNALGPQVSEIARSYVAGINAYIGLTVAQPQLLPPEFALLGYLPEPWAVDELVRRQQFGAGSIASKIRRAEMACRGLLDIDALRAPLEPAWTTSVPPGLDPCGITPADLSVLLSGPLPFRPGLEQTAPLKAGALGIAPDGARDGSNAWAVAPHFSATGRPILANDPHLPIGIPSVRYIIHLEAPGFAVAGGSAPGWPGIANGHNSSIGFGRTDFSLDRDDLYVLETKPDDPDSYRRSEGWQRFETIEEEIPVKGAAPARVELKFSSLGPVVSVQPDRHRALAVRASWMAQPGAIMLSQLPYNFANDWTSFSQAVRSYPAGTSFMYADVDGNIGWRPAGWVPVRPHHDGLLPVPGDGRYDWAGLTPLELLPSAFNPVQGWLANANQMSLPADYPVAERKLGFDWVPRNRYDRIVEVLQTVRPFSIADSIRLQHDTYSERARRLIPLLDGVHSELPNFEAARVLLQAWDRRVDAEGAPAILFERWWGELARPVANLLTSNASDLPFVDGRILIAALEKPDSHFGNDPTAGRDALLATTLDTAASELERLLGSDKSGWNWGSQHTVNLGPPLAALMDQRSRDDASVRGGRSGGDNATVMARWYRDQSSANVTGGAACSMVLDVGAWDNSLALNMPGQSGDPRSAHYRDLYDRWLKGEMFPLLFSRAKVDEVAEQRLRLSPIQ